MKRLKGRAFTLIELLISTAIFAAVAVCVFAALRAGISGYNKMDAAFRQLQQERSALKLLETDLKNAFIYRADESFFSGSSSTLEFMTVLNRYTAEGALLPEAARLTYVVEGDKLTRKIYRGFSAASAEAPGAEPSSSSLELPSVIFSYFYKDATQPLPYLWADSWPPAGKSERKIWLPLAVKVQFASGLEKTVPLELGGEGA
jgi:prepilin-type N-terminal cleavage/methylation domain-containing protein